MSPWLQAQSPTVGRDDGYRRVEVAGITAAEAMAPFGLYRFGPEQALDGDLGSSWQPRANTPTPWLELHFDRPTTVHALEIANGFQRVDALGDLFLMNRRPTRVTVSADGERGGVTLTLDPHARGYQLLSLPAPVTVTSLRLTILASAPGSRWQHIAVSEVRALTVGPDGD